MKNWFRFTGFGRLNLKCAVYEEIKKWLGFQRNIKQWICYLLPMPFQLNWDCSHLIIKFFAMTQLSCYEKQNVVNNWMPKKSCKSMHPFKRYPKKATKNKVKILDSFHRISLWITTGKRGLIWIAWTKLRGVIQSKRNSGWFLSFLHRSYLESSIPSLSFFFMSHLVTPGP